MIQTAFENLLKNQVTLSQAQISQGSVSHTHIRSLLGNKKEKDASFPWLIDGDFLSGSYARGTKIHPLDDIDVMVILDGTGLFPIKNGVQLNADVRGSGEAGSPVNWCTDPMTGYISSHVVLDKFHSAIKETYPNSTIVKDGQAINVWLESYGLGLDIVPAFHIVPRDGSRDFYYIPAGHGSSMWIETNPKIDDQICQSLDDRFEGKLKPVIKLLKYWNVNHNNGRLRSYHIESAVWWIFNGYQGKILSYDMALTHFFKNFTTYVGQGCPDPTGLGQNIDTYLAVNERQLSLQKIAEVQQHTGNAGLIGLYTPERRLSVWKKFFGDALK